MSAAPRRLLDAANPVAEFWDAHRHEHEVALPTSGTSGNPRTVVRTTHSWVDSFTTVSELARLGSAARVWIPGPLTATMNLFAAAHAHWVGAARVASLAAATHAQLTPTAVRRLLDDGANLAGRTLIFAGDTLEAGLRIRAEEAGASVAHYYGAAELSFVAWGVDADSLRPFPGVDVELRAADDPGAAATIWARSPFLALRTEGATGPLGRDQRGFATVGDRGRWNEDRLQVIGRDEAVVTGGTTVLLADVEAALRPGLNGTVAVVGLPHPELGAVVVAVLTDPADRDRARLQAEDLGSARPRRWVTLPDLPLTAAGKVDRRALAHQVGELR
ncbi:MAG TPA: AMP-binding protein [Propionibacteriaceae bacterium]